MMQQRLTAVDNRFSGWSNRTVRATLRTMSWAASLTLLAGLGGHSWAQAQNLEPSLDPAQSYEDPAQSYEVAPPPPDGAIPVPSYGSTPPSAADNQSYTDNQNYTGQQYVVFVNGDSDLLLEQVRLVEPTAFRTNFQGQTVIQAGRFNSSQNAEQLLNQLSVQGIGAEVAEAAAAVPYYAQAPVQSTSAYTASGDLPPIPTGAMPQSTETLPEPQQVPELPAIPVTPVGPSATAEPQAVAPEGYASPEAFDQGSVEFGQELSYSVPPNPNAYPVDTTPPGAAAAVPPTSARVNAPYYVVIPTAERNLPELSTQVIQLGTPADRVQQRLTPRGPHVAIGPFEERGLAYQWNEFYRQSGIANSRVYYDP